MTLCSGRMKNNIYLPGVWKHGWALDLHTLSSKKLGEGSFENEYSEIGAALNQLKYKGDRTKADFLASKAESFLKTRYVTQYLSVILPVPPSNERKYQPLFDVAEKLGNKIAKPVDFTHIFKRRKTEELKGVIDPEKRKSILAGAFGLKGGRYKSKKVLLIDDLYRSGSTLSEITRLLYEQEFVQDVYALTLTKTRTKT